METKDLLVQKLLLKRELHKRQARYRLLPFTTYTFPDYQVNWHHELTCNYLDAFLNKKIRRLMIFEPPRHGKSELTSRRLPALIHGRYPNDEILAVSYNAELASSMTIDVQRIMDNPLYEELFPTVRIAKHSGAKYKRTSDEHEIIPYQDPVDKLWHWYTGSYKSAGVGGSFTGRGANWSLIDDPIKNREDADSKAFRNMLWSFYTSTLRTRMEGEGSILITLTRWHDDDLASRLLRLAQADKTADQWVVLNLPAIKEHERDSYDPREIGEPLWPDKFSYQDLMKIKAMGMRDWSSLWQQEPTVEGGNIIKSDQIKYYTVQPERYDRMIQSWDFATKDKASSDFTVGQVWGQKGANKYLVAQFRKRASFPEAVKAVLQMSKDYPLAHKKLIEGKANGPAIIQTLKDSISGMVEVEPRGDKVARLNSVAPEFESGNVYLPDPSIAPWIGDYVKELCDFPAGSNDDQVDGTSQALDHLRRGGILRAPISGHGSGTIY